MHHLTELQPTVWVVLHAEDHVTVVDGTASILIYALSVARTFSVWI